MAQAKREIQIYGGGRESPCACACMSPRSFDKEGNDSLWKSQVSPQR